MNVLEVNEFFNKHSRRELIDLNFEPSIKPLEEFRNIEFPESAKVFLNLQIIPIKSSVTEVSFTLTKSNDRVILCRRVYQENVIDEIDKEELSTIQFAYDIIIKTIVRYADDLLIDQFVKFNIK